MNRAVFLDKDGTLIHDIPYNVDPAKITLEATATEALQRLQSAGFMLIVITNQPGLAHGYFDKAALNVAEARLRALLAGGGVILNAFYFCPHHPDGKVAEYGLECACRKPSPGMLLRAAADHRIDLSRSWMIGNILNDVEAGSRAGCRTILIDNGNETEWEPGEHRTPSAMVRDLRHAAEIVLNSEPVPA